MAKRQKKPDTYVSADSMMRKLATYLVRDFQSNLNNPLFCCDLELALKSNLDIAKVREIEIAPEEYDTIAQFKAKYQLQSVLKRYRFQKDTYNDDELIEKAISTFQAAQDRIRACNLDAVDAFTTRVLDAARIYIAQVLGVYSDEEHRDLCKFGKRASIGIPARSATEAERWELPISGSHEQIEWFDAEMRHIDVVQDYWARMKGSDPNRSTYQPTSSLTLTLVPKTFKSLRAIMPNTTIGSYMSYGLGEVIRKRLKRKGYDIKSLQQRHRVLACQASMHNMHTTADLSSASDSISVALVERLFPDDWVRILTQSRIGRVTLPNNQIVESLTFCTMGIGYTFPLQTLVFLALLKAIEATMFNRWNRRMISVYGDDMIYVSTMHSNVVRVFEQLGFVINLDKTFHEGHFRESCGGDYFRGVDVRPFQPRNGSASVSPKAYEAMLYKFINGLLMRWSEHEIGMTLKFLASEVVAITGKCKLVPGDYPDDAGIKCHTLHCWSFLEQFAVSKPKSVGHGVYRFSYLRLVPDEREEVRHEPYYWQRLRGYYPDDLFADRRDYPGVAPEYYHYIADLAIVVRELVELLKTREVSPIVTFRSSISGRRLRRTTTVVTTNHTGRYMRRSGTSCFEDRR